jgi:uncharacterized protein (TIGR02001 family)
LKKKNDRTKLISIVTAGFVLLSTINVKADISANVGFESEYIFRGIAQEKSSAYAGLDYSSNGFYIGTWAAQVTDGLEVDGFFGYSGSSKNKDFSYNLGFTGYYYTDDFDDTYEEINLGFGYKSFSINSAFGNYDNFDNFNQDYTFISASYEFDSGLYITVGDFEKDFDGKYFEFGYAFTLGESDAVFKYISSDSDLTGPSGDNFLIFNIGKSFLFDNLIK